MVATRFAVALQILLLLATRPPGHGTSARLAEEVGTNPVVIRRLAGQLARAGLIRIRRGPGGATLARDPEHLTLADVWDAMRRPTVPLLPLPRGAAPGDPMHTLLRGELDAAEHAMRERLGDTTLAEMVARYPASGRAAEDRPELART